jgi:ubiquinol-cytochrome c reductase cytochrome c subunit
MAAERRRAVGPGGACLAARRPIGIRTHRRSSFCIRTHGRLALSLAAALLLVAAPAASAQTAVKRGANLYAANCSSCHGAAGAGVTSFNPTRGAEAQPGLGPPLRGVGALAADFYLRTGYMPLERPDVQPRRTRSIFDEGEIRALVAYVASLAPGPGVPRPHPERGSVSQGLALFTEHCAGCHQVVAAGGYVTGAVAPPLAPNSPVQIAEAVRTGPYLMPRFSERALSDAELDSIIAYVQETKHPDDRGGYGLGHTGPVPEGLVTWFVAASALVATCMLIGRRSSG